MKKKISIIGIPTDINSSFARGAAKAPQKIMHEFRSEATNTFSENGINTASHGKYIFHQLDNHMSDKTEFDFIKNSIEKELKSGNNCISLGGDHSITYPIISAHSQLYPKLNIIHIDAHPDLYDDFDGNPFSHASPFARILENNLAHSLTQFGIRTMNDHQEKQANRFNVVVHTMRDHHLNDKIKLHFEDPIYISIDMDGLDPAFAPGVSHPEPGGLSTRDVINIIAGIKGEVIGADIVEYNPLKDINDITGVTAAKLLKELMGKILEHI